MKLIFLGVLCLIAVLGFIYGPTLDLSSVPSGIVAGDVAWLLAGCCLVLLMTPGLAFFYGGMVGSKNVVSTMFQSFIAMGVITVFWFTVGFSLAFGETMGGIIGNPYTYMFMKGVGADTNGGTIPYALFALFQLKFAVITPALISGAFAERIRLSSYLLFIVLFATFVYCPLAHMTWGSGGLLASYGVLDFAGGTVVHMAAGIAAIAAAILVGKRNRYQPGAEQVPANVPYILLGTGMLWFGWFGFNGGSSLGANAQAVHACMTTTAASSSAMLAWLLLDSIKGKKPSCVSACIAAVVGLVTITPAAGFVSVGASSVIGIIGAVASYYTIQWRSQSSLDDTLDVFACHGVGGIVGMLLTGAFATKGGLLVTGDSKLFVTHLVACVVLATLIFGMSFAILKATAILGPLKVSEEEEELGLDLSQHNEVVDDRQVRVKATS